MTDLDNLWCLRPDSLAALVPHYQVSFQPKGPGIPGPFGEGFLVSACGVSLTCRCPFRGSQATMTKRNLSIGLVALTILGAFAYGKWFSPTATVQRVADRFVVAITTEDLEPVQAMVAPDAKVSAAQFSPQSLSIVG